MRTRDQIVGSIVLVAAVIGVGSAIAYTKYAMNQAAAALPPPPEPSIVVRRADITEVAYRLQTTVIGTVLAPQSITLSNEVAGTVRRLGFESGEMVEAGQVMVELDTSVEQAELLASEARVRLTKSTLSRMLKAASSDAVTAAEVEEAQALYDQANAQVEQLKAVIARKTLKAPFKSRVGLSNTHLGQFLPSGFQIATLQSADDFVHIDFMIPQHVADTVRVGHQVKLVDEAADYPATIIALDARADRLSRNLMGRALLKPIPPQLRPGDSVRVVVDYGPELKTMSVPAEAIRRAPMNTFVYVAENDQENKPRAQARTVNVGQSVGQRVSILDGLQPDDQVVAEGSFKLREGALVEFAP